MANFIIQILRSKIAFASDTFFESTLNWNLTQNTKSEVDFVSVFNGEKNEDGVKKATLKVISDDEDVMIDPNSANIDKTIQKVLESNESCRVVNRYPTITFRVKGKIKALMAKGIVPTLDLAMDTYREYKTKADDIRNLVTWGDQPRAIDPDTGVEFTKEEHDQNRDLLNGYQFNTDLWKAIYKDLKNKK